MLAGMQTTLGQDGSLPAAFPGGSGNARPQEQVEELQNCIFPLRRGFRQGDRGEEGQTPKEPDRVLEPGVAFVPWPAATCCWGLHAESTCPFYYFCLAARGGENREETAAVPSQSFVGRCN